MTDDHPVVARFAPAPRLPAVAHVDPASRRQQRMRRAEVRVVPGDRPAAVLHGAEVDALVRITLVPVALHLTVHAQSCHPAVGIDVEPHVRPGALVVDRDVVVRVALQAHRRHDGGPLRGVVRLGFGAARIERGGRRIVAGEVRGVDVHALDDAGQPQLDDAVVVTAAAPAPRLPAVHPLAVVVELACDEYRGLRAQHALGGREPLVGAKDRLGTDHGLRQIDPARDELLRLVDGDVHLLPLLRAMESIALTIGLRFALTGTPARGPSNASAPSASRCPGAAPRCRCGRAMP